LAAWRDGDGHLTDAGGGVQLLPSFQLLRHAYRAELASKNW
jgi:hypothetical protein